MKLRRVKKLKRYRPQLIYFPMCAGDWGTIKHILINGRVIQVSPALEPGAELQPQIDPSQLTLKFE